MNDLLAQYRRVKSDPLLRAPRSQFETAARKAADALKDAQKEQEDASAELRNAWPNALYRPHFQKLENEFMGIRKLPVLPTSTDYLGASVMGISMPGILGATETSPLIPFQSLRNPRAVSQSPNLHGPDDAMHHLSFRIFVSTNSGQPQ